MGRELDPYLLFAWAGTSAVLTVLLLGSVIRVSRGSPRWAVQGDRAVRSLILKHEEEHILSGDPKLLLLGMMLSVLMPWNLALYWMAHRLRLAVELDCDARVLERPEFDVRTYGALLLEVGSRRAPLTVTGLSFSRPRSDLAARIERMTQGGPSP